MSADKYGYGPRVDPVLDCSLIDEYTREDWIALAKAALDQAGMGTAAQKSIGDQIDSIFYARPGGES